jgi:hypothetical protein
MDQTSPVEGRICKERFVGFLLRHQAAKAVVATMVAVRVIMTIRGMTMQSGLAKHW